MSTPTTQTTTNFSTHWVQPDRPGARPEIITYLWHGEPRQRVWAVRRPNHWEDPRDFPHPGHDRG